MLLSHFHAILSIISMLCCTIYQSVSLTIDMWPHPYRPNHNIDTTSISVNIESSNWCITQYQHVTPSPQKESQYRWINDHDIHQLWNCTCVASELSITSTLPLLIFSSQWWYDNSWLLSASVDRPSLKGGLIPDVRDSECLKMLQVKTAHKNFQFQN